MQSTRCRYSRVLSLSLVAETKRAEHLYMLPKLSQGHPWEELIHEVCGTKHWRHRDTGEIRLNDPFR